MKLVSLPAKVAATDVLELLSEAVAHAKADKVQSVAIILASGENIATMHTGDMFALNYGIDMLKARVFDE